MTLDDIRRMGRAVITPAIAAQVLGCDPAHIRRAKSLLGIASPSKVFAGIGENMALGVAARDAPEQLGFPVVRIGSRTKIPREAFVRYMEGGRT